MKKMIYSAFVGLGLMTASFGMVNAQSNAPANTNSNNGFGLNEQNTSEFSNLGGGNNKGDGIINVAKSFINWTLGLLSLIAFGMLLFGGFQMVTAGGDEEGYKKGFVYLKNAAIGIAFIALAWLIVSLIFYVLGVVGATSGS